MKFPYGMKLTTAVLQSPGKMESFLMDSHKKNGTIFIGSLISKSKWEIINRNLTKFKLGNSLLVECKQTLLLLGIYCSKFPYFFLSLPDFNWSRSVLSLY